MTSSNDPAQSRRPPELSVARSSPARPPVAAVGVDLGRCFAVTQVVVRSVMLRVPRRLRVSPAPRWQPDRLSGTVSGWRWSFT